MFLQKSCSEIPSNISTIDGSGKFICDILLWIKYNFDWDIKIWGLNVRIEQFQSILPAITNATVRPRSLEPFYIVSYLMNWVRNFWNCSNISTIIFNLTYTVKGEHRFLSSLSILASRSEMQTCKIIFKVSFMGVLFPCCHLSTGCISLFL